MSSTWCKTALLVLAFCTATPALPQATSATLTGTVTAENTPVAEVTITVASPALIGTRVTSSGSGGGYLFPSLPPGRYTVMFEKHGMASALRVADLNLAQTSRVDVDLKPGSAEEPVTRASGLPAVLSTQSVSTNISARLVRELPIGRTITSTLEVAPGVTPAAIDASINGGGTAANLYLVDGVIINDQVSGAPLALFIEDAIQEMTLIGSGLSAEYGRFTGGVVSTITASGGNEFSGSFRDSLTNNAWSKKTVFRDPQTGARQADPLDEINPVFEATFGGRILPDRLWFFGGGRSLETSERRQTVGLNYPYEYGMTERRIEGKLTGSLTTRHDVVLSYVGRKQMESNYVFMPSQSVDANSLTSRELPSHLATAHYTGQLTSNVLVEAQYSGKSLHFVGGGAQTTDRIYGTIIRDNTSSRRAWSPTFCGVCDPKKRDSSAWGAKGSYYLSTSRAGDHAIIAGVDVLTDKRTENNEQSGSNFRVWGDFILQGNDVFFHVAPDLSGNRAVIEYTPIALPSKGSDFKSEAAFVNDAWNVGRHLTLTGGLRYDATHAVDQAGVRHPTEASLSPRVAVTYDVRGDGEHRITASYGRYVARLDEGIADSTSGAGTPATIDYAYDGPEMNASAPYLTTDEVLRQVFAWFDAQGGIHARQLIFSQTVPGVDLAFKGSLASPYMDELTAGYGVQLGTAGYLRADYIHRRWSHSYSYEVNMQTGRVSNSLGEEFDLALVTNDNYQKRLYDGLQLQGDYRFTQRWLRGLTLGGNYTWSRLRGNGGDNPDVYYPEYTHYEQFDPIGTLSGGHRVNAWIGRDIDTPVGHLTLSALQLFHSALRYSANGSIDPRNWVTNPGYVTPPSSLPYFFSPRGEFKVDDIWRTDVAVNYTLPITRAQLFVEARMLNLTNNSGIEDPAYIRKNVYTNKQTANLVAFNPYAAPALVQCTSFAPNGTPAASCKAAGANWALHRDFGKPTSALAYQMPRTYNVSVGLRF